MQNLLLIVGIVLLLAGLGGGLAKLRHHLWSESAKRKLIKAWPRLTQEEKDHVIDIALRAAARKGN
jgi:hypothetical protein